MSESTPASPASPASPDTPAPGSLGVPTPATPPPAGVESAAEDSTPPTADPRVDDALSRLAEVDALPLSEQVEVYTDIHRRLAGVLADPGSQA